MAGPCRLRPASRADLAALADLERRAFSDPWSADELAEGLSWTGAIALIAEDAAGAIVGYALGRVIVDEGEILSLAADPDHRRGGVGHTLLTGIMAAMIDHGARAAWLEVRESNDAARAMYAQAGFVATGVRRGYYRRPPEDALVLRRQLVPAAATRSPVR
ncbi:MAG TPA: ribosomal protein S18-alanine N-acetyltransferase [Gemmatimonadales bacterium]|jgi:ribosomal-protein-alanine N-acetyltransferase|nr:ribosomal protein S18-alanine N-acetyltransferase [Gemmatimonadales bacterium]